MEDLVTLMIGPLSPESSCTLLAGSPVTTTGDPAKITTSTRDAGELTAVNAATREALREAIAHLLLNK